VARATRASRVPSLSFRMTTSTQLIPSPSTLSLGDKTDAPLFRLPVEPNARNGLRMSCRLMVGKITTVPKSKVGSQIGRLDDEDMLRLNQAILVFLGLAISPRTRR